MGINQGPISLEQKYTQSTGHVFTTGIQALVRLPMVTAGKLTTRPSSSVPSNAATLIDVSVLVIGQVGGS